MGPLPEPWMLAEELAEYAGHNVYGLIASHAGVVILVAPTQCLHVPAAGCFQRHMRPLIALTKHLHLRAVAAHAHCARNYPTKGRHCCAETN